MRPPTSHLRTGPGLSPRVFLRLLHRLPSSRANQSPSTRRPLQRQSPQPNQRHRRRLPANGPIARNLPSLRPLHLNKPRTLVVPPGDCMFEGSCIGTTRHRMNTVLNGVPYGVTGLPCYIVLPILPTSTLGPRRRLVGRQPLADHFRAGPAALLGPRRPLRGIGSPLPIMWGRQHTPRTTVHFSVVSAATSTDRTKTRKRQRLAL